MPKHRTSDHILVLKTICDLFKSKKKSIYLCFVDLRKAFDTVWRDGLFYKMQKFKISSKFINLTKSMYDHVNAKIRTKNGFTEKFPIEIGTKQGCNLSPSLFNIYLNDLPKALQETGEHIVFNDKNINCLMYADDLVLLAKSEHGLAKCVLALERYCNKWKLTINVNKTRIMVLNKKRATQNPTIKIYGKRVEVVTLYVYLGIEVSSSGTFKAAIDRLYKKACKAYNSLKQEFNFYNGTKPKVILKLFDTMVQPILTYGCEIWGCFGWTKQSYRAISNYIMNQKQSFEKLHIKVCKNSLGLNYKCPDISARSELGRYPIMGTIVKHIFSYWQHVLNSESTLLNNGSSSLLNDALKVNIQLDRTGHTSYYTRIKNLLDVLNIREKIYQVPVKSVKEYSIKIRSVYNKKFEEIFFSHICQTNSQGSSGRFEIYKQIKKNYRPEQYISSLENKNLRQHITKIRTSAHCLPIESLRKKRVPKELRLCNLCNCNIGSEFHVLMQCPQQEMVELRQTLKNKIMTINPQLHKFSSNDLFQYLLLANEKSTAFIFAIFLDKVFKLVKQHS